MGWFITNLKESLLYTFESPWRHSGPDDTRREHWLTWLIGWAWTLAGLLLGALVAPSLVNWAGLSNTSYQDWLVIGVAVLAGFVMQFVGWCLAGVLLGPLYGSRWVPAGAFGPIVIVTALLPLSGVGYAIYRYLTWVGAGQRSVTVAVVGGLLVKTFLIPVIKAAFFGPVLIAFQRWLRGNKANPA